MPRPERPLDPAGGVLTWQEFTLTPGTAVIVPRGQGHRIELDAPTDLMSLTIPHGTHLTDRAGD